MSAFIKKIKSWFKHIKIKKNSYIKNGISPVHDWRLIVALTAIILCCMVSFAYYFYIQINEGNLFKQNGRGGDQGITINAGLLQQTVNEINARADNLNQFNLDKKIPPDPSQ